MSEFGKGLPNPMGVQDEINKAFEPRPFQKEVFETLIKVPKNTVHQLPNLRAYRPFGIDFGDPKGDRTVVTRAKMNGKGQITSIIFNEYTNMPVWYRSPIKWWRFNRAMKVVVKELKKAKAEGKVWTSFDL